MSDYPPTDDHDESNDDHTTDDRFADETDHWLASLLSALESLESGVTSASGRRRSDRAVFEYDISIRPADDLSVDDSPLGRHPGGDRDRSRMRRIRSAGPSSDHNVAIRADNDELLVVADVAGADPDDVTVGFDDSVLVIAVGGAELDRIEVPWREPNSRATIKNGVLTVQVRPETTETEGPGVGEDDK
ncbi:Hsp20/alpha crystallin family protein [Natrinema hispanicum]|uniref:Molecular chaperone IbpA, HSP20 family n=1 Tax=Natrinema hispanicum TaxID=392421 RepID=A0A1G6LYK2_9EURY|nr:Hsp20/alpha crystallin family protein [Natrinema hispanicum]SDC47776.1 Molecular chaperone IbpA, HSP20 family [Natrinema hispanicum]SET19041.1 Molecular chaperone IbpA, HSP20 family [Natrinema hispanicum]